MVEQVNTMIKNYNHYNVDDMIREHRRIIGDINLSCVERYEQSRT